MLTAENIATLRRAAYQSQSRRADGPWAVVRFKGGPLDGIRLSVLQQEAVSPSLGFCTLTDTGPVQVLYSDAGHGRRVFECPVIHALHVKGKTGRLIGNAPLTKGLLPRS